MYWSFWTSWTACSISHPSLFLVMKSLGVSLGTFSIINNSSIGCWTGILILETLFGNPYIQALLIILSFSRFPFSPSLLNDFERHTSFTMSILFDLLAFALAHTLSESNDVQYIPLQTSATPSSLLLYVAELLERPAILWFWSVEILQKQKESFKWSDGEAGISS